MCLSHNSAKWYGFDIYQVISVTVEIKGLIGWLIIWEIEMIIHNAQDEKDLDCGMCDI